MNLTTRDIAVAIIAILAYEAVVVAWNGWQEYRILDYGRRIEKLEMSVDVEED